MADKPATFGHDCSRCIFLGHVDADEVPRLDDEGSREHLGGYDLYFHEPGHVTVIARFGSDGPDYLSGLVLADTIPVLGLARDRAVERGLLK